MRLTNTDAVAVLRDPEDRMHSGGDILQDCVSEHSSLTKTESDPQGDLSLPGEKSFVNNKEGDIRLSRKILNPLQTGKEWTDKERRGICILYVFQIMQRLQLLKWSGSIFLTLF